MLTEKEYMLICVSEEAASIAKNASKALRFGIDGRRQKGDEMNGDAIISGVNDMMAILEMMYEQGLIDTNLIGDRESIDIKKRKLEHWMEQSRKMEILWKI